jgi:hypothetical protein
MNGAGIAGVSLGGTRRKSQVDKQHLRQRGRQGNTRHTRGIKKAHRPVTSPESPTRAVTDLWAIASKLLDATKAAVVTIALTNKCAEPTFVFNWSSSIGIRNFSAHVHSQAKEVTGLTTVHAASTRQPPTRQPAPAQRIPSLHSNDPNLSLSSSSLRNRAHKYSCATFYPSLDPFPHSVSRNFANADSFIALLPCPG